LSAPAAAAPEQTKVESSRSQSSGPSSQGPAGGGAPDRADIDTVIAHDTAQGAQKPVTDRPWVIAAGLETHVAFVQTDPTDGRARGDKLYNFYYLTPQWAISPYDLVRADFGLYERFIADPGETGLRVSDISATYTRFIPLFADGEVLPPSFPPSHGVLLRAAFSATAPISFTSQLRSLITVPRLALYAERAFLDRTLIASVGGFGEYYFSQYRSAEGGAPNAISRVAAQATVEYYMPFLRQLSVSALVNSSWKWYYGADSATPLPMGVAADPLYPTQPAQQIYSAEIGARYALPNSPSFLGGLKSSVSLTYALGDNSVLHDGVQHLYFGFYRRSTELYATLAARY
jgi:hypothetical protein